MAYNIGQLRKSGNNSLYTTVIEPTVRQVDIIDHSVEFKNSAFDYALSSTQCYCLRFNARIENDFNPRIFRVKLTNNTSSLIIGDYSDVFSRSIEIVFQPNGTYNRVEFELIRNASDYDSSPANLVIENVQLILVNNLLGSLINSDTIIKLGVQSRPGFLMVIDGEAIKVGRTGIYQLHEGVSIRYFGIVVTSDEDKFIIDYKY